MSRARTVALLTDFGLRDHYVGAMKAVIKNINQKAQIIDISHHIPPQDIYEGAFTLYAAYKYFPEGTIFIAVVDPGVGTRRRIACVQTPKYTFLAPDNGLLSLVLRKEKALLAVEVTNPKYFLPHISTTFHGRDIFAPVAGHISKGLKPIKLGKKIDDLYTSSFPNPVIGEKGVLAGEVIHIDHFGNLITNIEHAWASLLESGLSSIYIKERQITNLSRTYQEGQAGELLALFGSSGHLEVSVNMGSAREVLGCCKGDKLIVHYKEGIQHNENS